MQLLDHALPYTLHLLSNYTPFTSCQIIPPCRRWEGLHGMVGMGSMYVILCVGVYGIGKKGDDLGIQVAYVMW